MNADAVATVLVVACLTADRAPVEQRGMLAAAKAVCGRCPVHVECSEYAHAIGAKDGIWAGRSAEKRRREGVVA